MYTTIERKKIIKENYNYGEYTTPNLWLKPDVFIIYKPSMKIKQTFEDFIIYSTKNLTLEIEDLSVKLPNSFEHIASEIERSRYLMSLEEDWDGEGGTSFDYQTWKRAVSFILDYALYLFNNHQNFIIDPPQINPGPETSIDLLWRNDKYRLLVNIPSNIEDPILYYGDNNLGENSIKGNLKSGPVQEFFALWLKNMTK